MVVEYGQKLAILFVAAEMSVIGSPPNNGANGAAVTPATPPLPSGPWHWAHFSA
jgi:hypothetical protein